MTDHLAATLDGIELLITDPERRNDDLLAPAQHQADTLRRIVTAVAEWMGERFPLGYCSIAEPDRSVTYQAGVKCHWGPGGWGDGDGDVTVTVWGDGSIHLSAEIPQRGSARLTRRAHHAGYPVRRVQGPATESEAVFHTVSLLDELIRQIGPRLVSYGAEE